MSTAVKVCAALILDLAAGEPPESLHPVCWMGKAVQLSERAARIAGEGAARRRLAGVAVAAVLPAGTFFASRAVLKALPRRWSWGAETALLSTALAARSLGRAGREVESGLGIDLKTGRRRVARMVGRDTADLDGAGVIRAAVESVAENSNDGVVAPMLYALLGGAPLAMAYKMVNTMDSMIGYDDERYRDLGWAAARLDDLAGFIPARLTALAVIATGGLMGASSRRALAVWRADASGHRSPNAGVCEAAFAGAMGVRLGGANRYGGRPVDGPVMGDGLEEAAARDIGRAINLMYAVAVAVLSAGMVVSRAGRTLGGGRRRAER